MNTRRCMNAAMAFVLILVFGVLGCGGGGSSKNETAVYTGPTTTLTGTLTLPTTVNEQLLASVRAAQNTDSVVRDAFASATIVVNGAAVTDRTITPSAVSPDWEIKLRGIPESSSGLYKIEVLRGRLGLKAWVRTASKDAFRMTSQTTGAALLAEQVSVDANDLLATYSALINPIVRGLEAAFNASGTITTSIFSLASITTEVTRQRDFLKNNTSFDPMARVAYLSEANDLDGDGFDDLFVRKSIDGTRVRFETTLSSATSMLEFVSRVASYSDVQVLNDFAAGSTIASRTFGSTTSNVVLGLFFKRAAGRDTYLKMLLKRIDIDQGTFRGVVAEYAWVLASGTAVATGTKIFARSGTLPGTGMVAASDFLTDGIGTAPNLLYLDAARGLGSTDGQALMLRAVQGQPELSRVTVADAWGRVPYYSTMSGALGEILETRAPAAGDVFFAYFPTTRHYAVLKIASVGDSGMTVQYVVNKAPGERSFKTGS